MTNLLDSQCCVTRGGNYLSPTVTTLAPWYPTNTNLLHGYSTETSIYQTDVNSSNKMVRMIYHKSQSIISWEIICQGEVINSNNLIAIDDSIESIQITLLDNDDLVIYSRSISKKSSGSYKLLEHLLSCYDTTDNGIKWTRYFVDDDFEEMRMENLGNNVILVFTKLKNVALSSGDNISYHIPCNLLAGLHPNGTLAWEKKIGNGKISLSKNITNNTLGIAEYYKINHLSYLIFIDSLGRVLQETVLSGNVTGCYLIAQEELIISITSSHTPLGAPVIVIDYVSYQRDDNLISHTTQLVGVENPNIAIINPSDPSILVCYRTLQQTSIINESFNRRIPAKDDGLVIVEYDTSGKITQILRATGMIDCRLIPSLAPHWWIEGRVADSRGVVLWNGKGEKHAVLNSILARGILLIKYQHVSKIIRIPKPGVLDSKIIIDFTTPNPESATLISFPDECLMINNCGEDEAGEKICGLVCQDKTRLKIISSDPLKFPQHWIWKRKTQRLQPIYYGFGKDVSST